MIVMETSLKMWPGTRAVKIPLQGRHTESQEIHRNYLSDCENKYLGS